jgi:DNA ligase-1
VQEKFDGVRALWDGSKLVSREGIDFSAPDWFLAGLPAGVPLDCELFHSRSGGHCAVDSVIKSANGWESLSLVIFDAPATAGNYTTRHASIPATGNKFHWVAPFWQLETIASLRVQLKALWSNGGEGFMLRCPKASYSAGRSRKLIKFKKLSDTL